MRQRQRERETEREAERQRDREKEGQKKITLFLLFFFFFQKGGEIKMFVSGKVSFLLAAAVVALTLGKSTLLLLYLDLI